MDILEILVDKTLLGTKLGASFELQRVSPSISIHVGITAASEYAWRIFLGRCGQVTVTSGRKGLDRSKT